MIRHFLERLEAGGAKPLAELVRANIQRIVSARSVIDGLDSTVPMPVGVESYSSEYMERLRLSLERSIRRWEPRLLNPVVVFVDEKTSFQRAFFSVRGTLSEESDDTFDFPVSIDQADH